MMKFQQVGSRLLNRSGGLNTTTQRCHLHVAGLECGCTIMFPFRSPATVNEIFCAFHVDVVPTKTPVTILRVQDRHYATELANSADLCNCFLDKKLVENKQIRKNRSTKMNLP